MGVSTEKMSTLLARGKCRRNFAPARLAKMKTGGHQQVLVSMGRGGRWLESLYVAGGISKWSHHPRKRVLLVPQILNTQFPCN